jgi:putative addiction module component (TIGR02574 family)
MSITAQRICIDVLSLPRKARAEIAHRLLVSLDENPASTSIEAEWKETAQRRYDNVKAGKTTCREAKDAIRDARKKFRKCA